MYTIREVELFKHSSFKPKMNSSCFFTLLCMNPGLYSQSFKLHRFLQISDPEKNKFNIKEKQSTYSSCFGYSIHFHLTGIFNKFSEYHRVILPPRQEKIIKFL